MTLNVLLLLETEAFIGHVGDGRVYLVRRGLVHQLTVDHSRGDEVLQFGEPGSAEREAVGTGGGRTGSGRVGPDGDRGFVRALGPEPRVRVESLCMELALEDRFVVCAASLHGAIPEAILHTRLTGEHLEQLGTSLVADAGTVQVARRLRALRQRRAVHCRLRAQARLAILARRCRSSPLHRARAPVGRPGDPPASVRGGRGRRGQPGTELYMVISGRVNVVKGGATIASLGPGSNFGEMAMLDDPVQSATARAAEDTELMVISRQAFFALLRGNPPLAVKMLWNLLLRLLGAPPPAAGRRPRDPLPPGDPPAGWSRPTPAWPERRERAPGSASAAACPKLPNPNRRASLLTAPSQTDVS